MCYVRGQAHMKLGDIEKAKACFKEALLVDVKCYNVCHIQLEMYYLAILIDICYRTGVGCIVVI